MNSFQKYNAMIHHPERIDFTAGVPLVIVLRNFLLGFVSLSSRNDFSLLHILHFTRYIIKWTIFRTDCLPKNNKRNGYAADEDEKDFRVNHLCRKNDAETDMPKGIHFLHRWQ